MWLTYLVTQDEKYRKIAEDSEAMLDEAFDRFADIAKIHAGKALKYILRPDGSSAHIAVFDVESGEAVEYPKGTGRLAWNHIAGLIWKRSLYCSTEFLLTARSRSPLFTEIII